jgi:hypothetical protein
MTPISDLRERLFADLGRPKVIARYATPA